MVLGSQLQLRFLPCHAAAETWSLQPGGSGSMALKSSGGGCLAAIGGTVDTLPCKLSDPAQLWEWNATAKNALPKGVTGFVRSHSATLSCPAKGGDGSTGCCLTNNGPTAGVYGCCPSGPSDCGNQIVARFADGTLRDARHPTDCLVHGAVPPPPPLHRRIETFEKLGMMDYESYESTPFVFHGKRLLMETIALVYPGHISHWKPEFKSCSSYYRIRDLASGVVLRNLTESCNHSFGSAFVDTHANGSSTLWVVGSSWYRPASAFATHSQAGLLGARAADGWGGTCKNGTECLIGAFSTSDPALQQWATGVALAPGRSSWNVDITTGRPSASGSKTYVMAIEQQPLAGAPAGSSWTSYFYVKQDESGAGDLTTGWQLLPTATHVIGGPGTHGACPTIRFIPDAKGGMYYVISGGLSVYLDRSRDLSTSGLQIFGGRKCVPKVRDWPSQNGVFGSRGKGTVSAHPIPIESTGYFFFPGFGKPSLPGPRILEPRALLRRSAATGLWQRWKHNARC